MHWYDEEKFDADHCWGLKGKSNHLANVTNYYFLESQIKISFVDLRY